MTLLDHRYHSFEGPHAGKTRSAGRAVAGCEVRIVDLDDNEVPRGTVGEICGRGPLVMLGIGATGTDRSYVTQRLAAHR